MVESQKQLEDELRALGMLEADEEAAVPVDSEPPETSSLTMDLQRLAEDAVDSKLDLDELEEPAVEVLDNDDDLRDELRALGMLEDDEEAQTDPETTDIPENPPRFRRLRVLRETIAQQNGISFPRRENFPLSMPDLSSLLDFLPARDQESGLRRRLQRLFPNANEAFIETQLEKLRDATEDTEATTSKFKEYLAKMKKDVPWQTMVLSTAKPIAKVAATTVIRSTGKDLAAIPLAQLLGASSLVAPVAAGVVAGVFDSYRLATGGREKLYKSAAQDTWAALTTGRGSERKGNESEAEFQKNRFSRPIAAPIFLLRKIGVFMNTLRSTNTKLWMGITRDRSKISKELALLDSGAETITDADLSAAILAKLQDSPLKKEDLLKLNRPLARLRAVSYGTIDVAGERGTRFNRVAERHTAQRLKQLHEVLNELITSDQITLTESEKARWIKEYEDVERKSKDKTRKVGMIVGNSVATFLTLGIPAFVSIINEKIENFDFEAFKQQIAEQIENARTEDGDLDLSSSHNTVTTTSSPSPTATPSPTSTPTATATPTEVPNSENTVPELGHSQRVDEAVTPESIDAHIDSTATPEATIGATEIDGMQVNGDTVADADLDTSSTGEVVTHVGTAHTNVGDAEPQPFGMGTNRIDTDSITTSDTAEVGTQAGEVAEATGAADSVEIADAAIEIQDLGDDELPWNAIYNSIQNNPSVNVSNINGTTNVIKNIYKALNNNLPMGTIGPDSGFAILPDAEIPTELPDGAVAYFFSEEQIENLAEQIDQAINLSKEGSELTDMQEVLVQLNGGRVTFEDLAQDPDLLEDILEIANER